MIGALRHARFEDVVGVVALFLFLGTAFWICTGLGLETGADQLTVKLRP